jgi:hypothetical protein
MTSEELEASYNELARLAGELHSGTNPQDNDKFGRTVATVGQILANMAKMVADSKFQLDDVAGHFV